MKKEWKDKWVAALRSGEYEQGKNRLRSADNKFCCLGVLCDLVIKEHPEYRWERNGLSYAFVWDDADKECFTTVNMPQNVRNDIVGALPIAADSFIDMNDDLDYSFNSIYSSL